MRAETFAAAATVLAAVVFVGSTQAQRISTIQLDGVQYFISRMNPYSPELNYFLAYQYCRSLGLQLTSFETREKADAMATYLKNAGHQKYDFWTSGNRLGTDMMLWMSTGLPFNATFDYMRKPPGHVEEGGEGGEGGEGEAPVSGPSGEGDAENEARSDDGASHSCVVLKAPDHHWATDDCTAVKDFICEQTRCYYYNYGSVPVSAAQGPLLVSAIIASIEKAQRHNEAARKDAEADDRNKHVGRHIDGKNSNPNVVYVKAVGAKNGQAAWSLAYVNSKDNASKADETPIDSRPVQRPTTVTRRDNERRLLDQPTDQ